MTHLSSAGFRGLSFTVLALPILAAWTLAYANRRVPNEESHTRLRELEKFAVRIKRQLAHLPLGDAKLQPQK